MDPALINEKRKIIDQELPDVASRIWALEVDDLTDHLKRSLELLAEVEIWDGRVPQGIMQEIHEHNARFEDHDMMPPSYAEMEAKLNRAMNENLALKTEIRKWKLRQS